jgi:polysaccharide biosynthesis protein PslH
MRILDVSPMAAYPPENGASMRIYHILRSLSERHVVRQFSQSGRREIERAGFVTDRHLSNRYLEHHYTHPLSVAAHERFGRSWIFQFVIAGEVLRLTRPALLREWLRWAEVVLVEFPWQFPAIARLRPRAPLVLASHNVEVPTRASNARAAGVSVEGNWWLRYVAHLEREAVARADLILVVSEDDFWGYVKRYGVDPARLVLAPNAADTASFVPAPRERRSELRRLLDLPERPTAVFISGNPKPPDLVALDWIRRLARAAPDVTFLVIGGVVRAPEKDGNLIATGSVDEPWRYLQAADVSISPIAHGGGTKIKVLDSLAAGLPSLVFAETTRGMELVDGEHVVVVDKDEVALLSAIRRVLADRALADRLGSAGRRFVVRHRDWRLTAQRVERALLELVGSGRYSA